MFDIKSLLKKSIKRAGADDKINEIQVIKIFNKLAKELLPNNLRMQIKPVYYKEGILSVASLSAAAAEEILCYSKKIIKEINNKLGQETIKNIKYIT